MRSQGYQNDGPIRSGPSNSFSMPSGDTDPEPGSMLDSLTALHGDRWSLKNGFTDEIDAADSYKEVKHCSFVIEDSNYKYWFELNLKFSKIIWL